MQQIRWKYCCNTDIKRVVLKVKDVVDRTKWMREIIIYSVTPDDNAR